MLDDSGKLERLAMVTGQSVCRWSVTGRSVHGF